MRHCKNFAEELARDECLAALVRILEFSPKQRSLQDILTILNEAAWARGLLSPYCVTDCANDDTRLESALERLTELGVLEPARPDDGGFWRLTNRYRASMSDIAAHEVVSASLVGVPSEIIKELCEHPIATSAIAKRLRHPNISSWDRAVPVDPTRMKRADSKRAESERAARLAERIREECPMFPPIDGPQTRRSAHLELVRELAAVCYGGPDNVTLHNAGTVKRRLDRFVSEGRDGDGRLDGALPFLIGRLPSDMKGTFDMVLAACSRVDIVPESFPPCERTNVFKDETEMVRPSRTSRILDWADGFLHGGVEEFLSSRGRGSLLRAAADGTVTRETLDFLSHGLDRSDARIRWHATGIGAMAEAAVTFRSADAFRHIVDAMRDPDIGVLAVDACWSEGIEAMVDVGMALPKGKRWSALEAWLRGGGRSERILRELLERDPSAPYEGVMSPILGRMDSMVDRIFRSRDLELLALVVPHVDPDVPSMANAVYPAWCGIFSRSEFGPDDEFFESAAKALSVCAQARTWTADRKAVLQYAEEMLGRRVARQIGALWQDDRTTCRSELDREAEPSF